MKLRLIHQDQTKGKNLYEYDASTGEYDSPYRFTGRTQPRDRQLLSHSQFPIPYSPFPIPHSLFPIPYSQFPKTRPMKRFIAIAFIFSFFLTLFNGVLANLPIDIQSFDWVRLLKQVGFNSLAGLSMAGLDLWDRNRKKKRSEG